MHKYKVFALLLIGYFFCLVQPIHSTMPIPRVMAIEIKGNQHVSSEVILARIRLQINQDFSQEVLNSDIERLYATGFFSDIRVNTETIEDGIKVILMVTERAVISSVEFEGNRAISSRRLKREIESKPMGVLDPGKIRRDIEKIKGMYIDRGWANVEVTHDVRIQEEEQRAILRFIINEGRRLRVRKINIGGNYAFPDREILRIIKTRRRTIFTSGFLRREVLREDMERIRTFYRDQGFLDVRADYRMEEKDGFFYITINVDEGRKYYVGDIAIQGNTIATFDELVAKLSMRGGAVFTEEGLRSDVGSMKSYYFERGFISARIRANTTFNTKTDRMDILYTVVEHEKAYVRMIDIKGNVKTKDEVIRRELRLHPGDAFDGEELRRSRERLHRLGFFEEISYEIEDTDIPNVKDLIVRVKETKTGEFAIGAGYSTVDGLLGFVRITQRNFDLFNWPTFTGAGQSLSLYVSIAEVRQNYEISFTEPWLFGYPLLFGFDIYDRLRQRGLRAGYGFDERRSGGALRLGQEFTEYARWDTTYRLEEVEISNIIGIASQALRAEEGTNLISSLELKLTQDTRDDKHNPTRGHITYASVRLAGGPFGGDKDYTIYQAGYSMFHSIAPEWVLELSTKGGFAESFGRTKKVPIYDRFYAGGLGTIRGYDQRAVGPRDPLSTDPIGGNVLWLGSAELTFPLFTEHFRGAIFYDAGFVWADFDDMDFADVVSGVGVGVKVRTPIGPVRIDVAYPLNLIPGERQEIKYYFSMGHRF